MHALQLFKKMKFLRINLRENYESTFNNVNLWKEYSNLIDLYNAI